MSRAPILFDNAAWPEAAPRLSILTPFMRDDPRPLLHALECEGSRLGQAVELVLLDDGGGDGALAAAVRECVTELRLPVRFIRLLDNEGRSKGRNRLAEHARAEHLLFLDADMLPDSPGFLSAYLDLIERNNPAVVFGGFSVAQAPRVRKHALHRNLALRSDCLSASARQQAPAKYVFTSNLMVRRDIFEAEAFDEAFAGWGWEDVEWGARIARRWPITHVDNPATHLGLDTARSLIAKYRQSVANFQRIARTHPELVCDFPSYRAAKLLAKAPLRRLWRPALAALARQDWAPVAPRAFALRLYRSALYSDVV